MWGGLSLSLALAPRGFGEASLDPLRPAMEQAMARVKPSLVRIQVVWVDYAQGREIKHEASGSGFNIKVLPIKGKLNGSV